MGATVEDSRFLAHTAHVHWDHSKQRLLCDETYLQHPQCLELLSAHLLSCWRCHTFTASRWCTVGIACREVSLAMCKGFLHMFDFMVSSKVLSAYEAGGPHKITKQCKDFVLVIGLVAYVPDSVLAYTLNENRLATRLADLEQVLAGEMDFLEGLQRSVWVLFSKQLELPWPHIRDAVMRGALIAQGYLDEKLLAGLRRYPWTVCQNPVESLEQLAQQPEPPAEQIASKVWSLLKASYPRQGLVQAIHLLAEISFSTSFTEKQHGSSDDDAGAAGRGGCAVALVEALAVSSLIIGSRACCQS